MNKGKKFTIKKIANIMFIVVCVFTFLFLFISLGYFFIEKSMGYTISTAGQITFIIFGVLFLLSILIEAGFQLTCWFQGFSAHVAKYQGEKCFEEIDSYIKNLGESNSYYRSVIFEMNKIYETNSELQQLIKSQNLESLYTRKTYLENNLGFYDNTIQLVSSLGISSVVVLAQAGVGTGKNPMYGYFIIAGILFIFCAALKYIAKGKGDSYIYNLYEHELKLLNEKIVSVNKHLHANEDFEKILQLRQVITNVLINLYNHRKELRKSGLRKKNIEEMYRTLYELPLLTDLEVTDIIWAKISICESKYYFPLRIDIGQYKCLSKNYEKIYEMLQKIHLLN